MDTQKTLFVLVYRHRHGEDLYPFYATTEPDAIEELLCRLQGVTLEDSLFESDREDEELEIYTFQSVPDLDSTPLLTEHATCVDCDPEVN